MRRGESIDPVLVLPPGLLDQHLHFLAKLILPLLQDRGSVLSGPVQGVDLVGVAVVVVQVFLPHQLNNGLQSFGPVEINSLYDFSGLSIVAQS